MVPSVTTAASRQHDPVGDQPDRPSMSATSSLAPASTAPCSLVPPTTVDSSLDANSTPPLTNNLWPESTDYRAYLSVINLSSDEEEFEDLYAALSASMEDQM